jgi:hypothetical protein
MGSRNSVIFLFSILGKSKLNSSNTVLISRTQYKSFLCAAELLFLRCLKPYRMKYPFSKIVRYGFERPGLVVGHEILYVLQNNTVGLVIINYREDLPEHVRPLVVKPSLKTGGNTEGLTEIRPSIYRVLVFLCCQPR